MSSQTEGETEVLTGLRTYRPDQSNTSDGEKAVDFIASDGNLTECPQQSRLSIKGKKSLQTSPKRKSSRISQQTLMSEILVEPERVRTGSEGSSRETVGTRESSSQPRADRVEVISHSFSSMAVRRAAKPFECCERHKRLGYNRIGQVAGDFLDERKALSTGHAWNLALFHLGILSRDKIYGSREPPKSLHEMVSRPFLHSSVLQPSYAEALKGQQMNDPWPKGYEVDKTLSCLEEFLSDREIDIGISIDLAEGVQSLLNINRLLWDISQGSGTEVESLRTQLQSQVSRETERLETISRSLDFPSLRALLHEAKTTCS